MMGKMTPVIERLVRLMILLPEHHKHPLWESVIADRGETADVMAMRWFVGDAARMWPPAGPHNLASAVLTAFGAPSETTLRLLSDALVGKSEVGLQAGAAWVTQATAAAIEVLAQSLPLDEVLHEVEEHWTLKN